MTRLQARDVVDAINARNARQQHRVDRALNLVFALLLGILGALLLAHWLTPCEGVSLCAGVIPLRPNLRQRAERALRRLHAHWRAYKLRCRIGWAEEDLMFKRADLERLPRAIAHVERHAEVLRCELASAELDARRE